MSFRSFVFLIYLLLFQFFRLKVPGREIDSGDDGLRSDDNGKGSCIIFNKICLGLEDQW